MKISQLVNHYKKIGRFINKKWPLKNKNQRIFARYMKIVEELGELSDEILTSMNLQRNSKTANFCRQNLEDEFADVMATLILLSIELDVDIEGVMKRKIKYTYQQLDINKKS